MMEFSSGFRQKVRITIGFALAATLLAPAPATAKGGAGIFLLILQNASVVMTTASRCVTFTYDKNGNRQAQTIAVPPTATPTWGSSSYGCFAWQN